MTKAFAWLAIAGITYGVAWLVANRAIYYPMKYPAGWWEARTQAGATDVWLTAADGVRLHAWWIPLPESKIATLYLHGNAGNLSHRIGHLREITAAGSSVFIIDYRGYGRSEGHPTEKGLYADAEAGYRHLVNAGYVPEEIILHGESLGTAVAVDLASRLKCGGVVLEAPFTSAGDVAGSMLPVLGRGLVWGFDSERKISNVHAPVLIFHGDNDEVIPYRLGRRLFEAANEPKFFRPVPGAGHNDIVETAGERYREWLSEFYRNIGA
ncbi:MAG: alpha/beta hydrolase [Bryobacteraceae bacterium]